MNIKNNMVVAPTKKRLLGGVIDALFFLAVTAFFYFVFFEILDKFTDYRLLNEEAMKYYKNYIENIPIDKISETVKAQYFSYQKTLSLYSAILLSASTGMGTLFIQFLIPLFFKNGQTIGKRLLGLQVRRCSGKQLTISYLFLRVFLGLWIGEIVISLFLAGLTLLITFLSFLFTPSHRMIHDFVGDSVVIDITLTNEYRKRIKALEM